MMKRTLACIPLLILLGLVLSACGANITVNVPTIGPVEIGVTAGAEQPTSQPPAENQPAPTSPANPDGNTMTLLLFGIIALVIIVALFGLVALMRRPEEPPS